MSNENVFSICLLCLLRVKRLKLNDECMFEFMNMFMITVQMIMAT